MKVNELITLLQQLDPEKEVRVSIRENYRPRGTKEITTVDALIDQDTNTLGFYAIDVDISNEYPQSEEKLIIPENEREEEYK